MSTKIIHVLKSDGFDEVFDLFKNTEASEVIFILPKGSKLAKQSQHFTAIKREADSSGKHISIMTADPIVAQFASQNDIELIRAPETKKHETRPEPTIALADNSEDEAVEDYENAEPEVKFAAVRTATPTRTIKDIVRPERENKRPVKINEDKMKSFEVEIAKRVREGAATGDITQVWASREQETGPTFKAGQNIRRIKSSPVFRRSPLFFVGGTVIVLFLILYAT